MDGLRFLPLVVGSLGACAVALAQPRPDAGALQEQIERDLRRSAPPAAVVQPAPTPPAAAPAPSEGLRVILRAFRLEGNRLVSEEALQALLQPSLGQALTRADMLALTRTLAAHYRQQGWIARVLLPPQDLSDGTLTIRIVESTLGGLLREGPEAQRVDTARVEARLLARQRLGAPLNTRDLDRGVLLADDLAGVRVQGAYMPGEREGETRYAYRLQDEPLWRGDVKLDNHGSASTGASRWAAAAGLNSPLGAGEQWQAQVARSRGTQYVRLSLGLPVGVAGWRLGVSGSAMEYTVTAPAFASLGLAGDSSTLGLEASYPLLRTARHNLTAVLGIDHKRFLNRAAVGVLSDYASTSGQLALSWNRQDRLGGGGASFGQLGVSQIRLHAHRAGPQAQLAPEAYKLRYTLGRQQTLGADLNLLANLSGQWAADVLDSSEKFSLGGPAGVRAYASGEGSGSRANLLNLELRWRLSEQWAAAAFYDRGSASEPKAGRVEALQGAGLLLDHVSAGGLFASALWGYRIGLPVSASPVEAGQAQRPPRHQLWLSAGWRF